MATWQLVASVTAIMVTVITGFAAIGRLLWKVSQKWTEVIEQLKALTYTKDSEHRELRGRIDRLESRVDRHEEWHTERSRK
jgi:hypothetical protein